MDGAELRQLREWVKPHFLFLFRYAAAASRSLTPANGDKQVIPNCLDLCFRIAAENIRERVRLARRKKRRHSCAGEDLLRIG